MLIMSLLTMMLFTVFAAEARNLLEPGTTLLHRAGTMDNLKWGTSYLGDEITYNDEVVIPYFVGQSTNPIFYIKNEVEKVYWKSELDDNEWNLLYDFGIEVGQEITITKPANSGIDTGKIVCTERPQIYGNYGEGSWIIYEFVEVNDRKLLPQERRPMICIDGFGSIYGLDSEFPGEETGLFVSYVAKITSPEGVILYEAPGCADKPYTLCSPSDRTEVI